MSTATLPRLPRVIGSRKTVAIIASIYNESYVNALVEATRAELTSLLPTAAIPLFRVPGANEIPTCAQFVAERVKPDVIIALGVVIRGETAHADLVATSVSTTLQDIARERLLPIINEVLLLDNEEQAKERCYGTRMNRGTEAARAAANMAELFEKMESTYPDESANPKRSKAKA